MRALRILACALALAVVAAGSASAQQAPLLKLRVATIPSDIGAEVYYAKDMGFFAKAGLDVEITPITNGAAISSAKIPADTLQTATRVTYATVLSAQAIQPNIDVAAKYGFLLATFPARDLISPLALK